MKKHYNKLAIFDEVKKREDAKKKIKLAIKQQRLLKQKQQEMEEESENNGS